MFSTLSKNLFTTIGMGRVKINTPDKAQNPPTSFPKKFEDEKCCACFINLPSNVFGFKSYPTVVSVINPHLKHNVVRGKPISKGLPKWFNKCPRVTRIPLLLYFHLMEKGEVRYQYKLYKFQNWYLSKMTNQRSKEYFDIPFTWVQLRPVLSGSFSAK